MTVGRLTGALFADLKKAFDIVPHKEFLLIGKFWLCGQLSILVHKLLVE